MNHRLQRWLVHALLLAMAVITIYPLVWMVFASVMRAGAAAVVAAAVLAKARNVHPLCGAFRTA